jgi:hypothetical protein
MIRPVLLGLLALASFQARALENLPLDGLGVKANGNSYTLTVSGDGRFVVFDSMASNLVAVDGNGVRDIFLYDRNSSALELISVDSSGHAGTGHSRQPDISADGRYVVFESQSALAPGVSAGNFQIYLRDRVAHSTRLISADVNGNPGNGASLRPRISSDGSLVLFYSSASNLTGADSNGYSDVFIKHVATGQVERVSMAYGGGQANNGSYEAEMSGDGRYVVFVSQASNIVSPVVPAQRHVYWRDRQNNSVRLISHNNAGAPANGACFLPDVDDAGQRVVYYSNAANLAPGLNGSTLQVVVHNVASGTTELVSRTPGNVAGNDHSYNASISGDGRQVVFTSFATNLFAGDGNTKTDVIVRDLASGEMKPISLADNGNQGNDNIVGAATINSDGSVIAFTSYASNLVANDDNGYADVFISVQNQNTPPVAMAGANQQLECSGLSTPVTLDGRASSDADGDVLSYLWSGSFGQAQGAVVTVPMALGTHNATLAVDDGRGGQDSAGTTVTIRDSVAPALSVPATVRLEAASRAGTIYELNPVTNDACSDVSLAIAPSYNTYPLGDTTVTVTATDSSGNSRRADVAVTVADTTAPQLQVPAAIRKEAEQRQTLIDIGTATATDIFDITLSNNAPAAFPLGTTVVTWRAQDSNGNATEAGQSITVEDTTAPVLTVPADVNTEATAVETPLTLLSATATDIFDVAISNNAPAAFPLGSTAVTWRAEDESGNVASATQQVTLRDTTPPQITAPAGVTAEATGATTVVALGTPTASDIFPVTVGNDAPAAFPLGNTTVTWAATDSSDNSATATQQITVRDTTAPTLAVPADIVVEAQGVLTPIALASATAEDLFAVSVSNDAPPLFSLGTTVVTWRAEDSNGNLSTGQQRITVVDATAPTMQFEQLHSIIWPPNNRLKEVARVSGVSDIVDSQPRVDINVEVVDTPRSRQRPSRDRRPYERPGHGDHDDRGGATGRDHDGHDNDYGELHRGNRSENRNPHHRRPDWKVVERDGVWHIYVRASLPDHARERSYDISVTVSDASGNSTQQQAQVVINNQERHRH